MENKHITSNEVAKYLQVSQAQAYIMMKKGKIRTVRFGKCVRVRDIALDEYSNRNLLKESNNATNHFSRL